MVELDFMVAFGVRCDQVTCFGHEYEGSDVEEGALKAHAKFTTFPTTHHNN